MPLNLLIRTENIVGNADGTINKVEREAVKLAPTRNIYASFIVSSYAPTNGKWEEVESLQELLKRLTVGNLAGFYKNSNDKSKSKSRFFISVPLKASLNALSGKLFKTASAA